MSGEAVVVRAGRREWVALVVLALAVLLLAVDGTVLSLAIPALTEALHPSASQVLWIGDIYSFALAGLLVTMGALGDRIGRKRLLLIGVTGFGAASALAAFAPSAGWLIAARGRHDGEYRPLSSGVSVSRSRMDHSFVHKGRNNGPDQA